VPGPGCATKFTFRCIYCLLREQWGRLRGTFDLDHFHSVAHHPEQATAYDNLLYSCATCNAAKGCQLVPNPCQVLLRSDVQVLDDGSIKGTTRQARRLSRVLGLDDPECSEFRLLWIGIVALASRHDPELYQRLLGFPDDLPDLSRLRPPGGNIRPDGIEASYFRQRQRDTLPAIY
jgi:hypothetical protein